MGSHDLLHQHSCLGDLAVPGAVHKGLTAIIIPLLWLQPLEATVTTSSLLIRYRLREAVSVRGQTTLNTFVP